MGTVIEKEWRAIPPFNNIDDIDKWVEGWVWTFHHYCDACGSFNTKEYYTPRAKKNRVKDNVINTAAVLISPLFALLHFPGSTKRFEEELENLNEPNYQCLDCGYKWKKPDSKAECTNPRNLRLSDVPGVHSGVDLDKDDLDFMDYLKRNPWG